LEINNYKRRRKEDGYKHKKSQTGKIWEGIEVQFPITSLVFVWGTPGGVR